MLLSTNENITLKQAKLIVKPHLTGIRWFMHEWFLTCLFIGVSTLTLFYSFTVVLIILFVRRMGFMLFL